jgi:hypothetical protein
MKLCRTALEYTLAYLSSTGNVVASLRDADPSEMLGLASQRRGHVGAHRASVSKIDFRETVQGTLVGVGNAIQSTGRFQ